MALTLFNNKQRTLWSNSGTLSTRNLVFDSPYNSSSNISYFESPEQPKWYRNLKGLMLYFFNPQKRHIMGRTHTDFFKLIVFYFSFYAILFGLFCAMMQFFLYFFIMQDYPMLTGDSSVLRLNPGLSVVPINDYLTPLVRFHPRKKFSYRKYTDAMIAYTQWYEDITSKKRFVDCAQTGRWHNIDDTRVSCRQSLDMAGPCNIWKEFGFDDGTPCFLLKLNRVYGWVPDPDPTHNFTGVGVKCEGRYDADQEHMGPLCYYDDDTMDIKNMFTDCKKENGEFKDYYFPYMNQISYQSPLVFVKFMAPRKNVIIMVKCYAIAKNIHVDILRREGSVTFEFIVE